jgi:23S rRNA (uracil1939-C5)-methyltransferase
VTRPTREPPTPDRRTLRVDRLAAGGDGVARDNGLVIFVPRTAPGDVVEADVAHDGKARFARGRLREVLTPSAERVVPPCVHYVRDACGGCQLQHLTYAAQVQAKSEMVADAFRRIARRDVQAPLVHAAPAAWGYRRKLTLALRRTPRGYVMGMHAYDDVGPVFPLEECLLAEPAVMEAWHAVRGALPHFPLAETLRVAVRRLGDGVALVIEGGENFPESEALAAAVPGLVAIWWEPAGRPRRLVVDRRGHQEPGASFVQVNPAMQAVLQEAVVAHVAAHRPATVVDAYAGAGDTAAALASLGMRVTAIESDADAAAFAATRLPRGSRSVTARVEDALADALPADVVLLNPPRGGLHVDVTRQLDAARGTRAIVYVSCDPATLARDVARLPGWRVAQVSCYDMFPQTAHVETLCELVPDAA